MLLASDPPVPQAPEPQTAKPEPQLLSTFEKQLESRHDPFVQAWLMQVASEQVLSEQTSPEQLFPAHPVEVQEVPVQGLALQALQVHCSLPVIPPMAASPRSTFKPSSMFPNGDIVEFSQLSSVNVTYVIETLHLHRSYSYRRLLPAFPRPAEPRLILCPCIPTASRRARPHPARHARTRIT